MGDSPLEALPYGVAQMGVAAVLAVGVWYLTGAVPLQTPRKPRLAAAHVAAIVLFAVSYAAAQGLADGKPAEAQEALERAVADRHDFWWARDIALPQAARSRASHASRRLPALAPHAVSTGGATPRRD